MGFFLRHIARSILGCTLLLAPLKATYIETFSDNTNTGGWQLTTNPNRPTQPEPSGGNPGAYLRGQFAGAVPTWYVPVGASSPFLGSYQSDHVTALSLDLNIMQGFQAPDRFLTLDLQTSFGTGDFSKGLEAFYIGADISNFQPGWFHYNFSLPATSAAIPSGWTLLRGDGSAASASDWGQLMSDVETVGFELGAPGYAYPSLGLWDLGLDNPSIFTAAAPEPAPVATGAAGLLLLVYLRRRH